MSALKKALDLAYPIPNNPHASVVQRAMDNRIAFGRGWDAALSAQSAAGVGGQKYEVLNMGMWDEVSKEQYDRCNPDYRRIRPCQPPAPTAPVAEKVGDVVAHKCEYQTHPGSGIRLCKDCGQMERKLEVRHIGMPAPMEIDAAMSIIKAGLQSMREATNVSKAVAQYNSMEDVGRAALAAQTAAGAAPRWLFDRKLADLQQRGYDVIGRILHKDGQYALFDSSCRWLTQPQYQRLMHEQDGSLFADKPAPAQGEALSDELLDTLHQFQGMGLKEFKRRVRNYLAAHHQQEGDK